jgi:hypothetical protein
MTSWIRPITNINHWDILLRLTLIEIILRPAGPWTVRPFILLLACAGIIFSSLLRSPLLWLLLFALIGTRIILDWPTPDNHIYLLAYWCLLLFFSLRSPLPDFTLKSGSKYLIAFAFALAVLWKSMLSPDYIDGRFFRVTLLTDERFAATSMLIGGLTKQELRENREYLVPLPEGAELVEPLQLIEPPRLRAFAFAATWGALFLESLVAILFLLPGARRFERPRHVALLLFCLATYPFAPVAGFGWLLLVMGLAQCNPDQKAFKALYIISYFLVLLFAEIPWAGAILDWMNP